MPKVKKSVGHVRDQYDRDNLRIAKLVRADPAKYGHLVEWAQLVLHRLGPKQSRLLLEEPQI